MMQPALAYAENAFLHDVLLGLACPHKYLPCKYLYNATGSELFERICLLEDYYLTRTELKIMHRHMPGMAQWITPQLPLIELGAGAGVKTKWLLEALPRIAAYIPVDISLSALTACARSLSLAFPTLSIQPILGDYMEETFFQRLNDISPATVFFPGSTLGNLTRAEALALLRRIRNLMGKEGGLLIGVDLMKDEDMLLAAYNDRQGVTAEFNKNLLMRINNELSGDVDTDAFAHEATVNQAAQRVEMHLVSKKAQSAHIGGQRFDFSAGERIHTENCHKYSHPSFHMLAQAAGLAVRRTWTDEHGWYAVHYLTMAEQAL